MLGIGLGIVGANLVSNLSPDFVTKVTADTLALAASVARVHPSQMAVRNASCAFSQGRIYCEQKADHR